MILAVGWLFRICRRATRSTLMIRPGLFILARIITMVIRAHMSGGGNYPEGLFSTPPRCFASLSTTTRLTCLFLIRVALRPSLSSRRNHPPHRWTRSSHRTSHRLLWISNLRVCSSSSLAVLQMFRRQQRCFPSEISQPALAWVRLKTSQVGSPRYSYHRSSQ